MKEIINLQMLSEHLSTITGASITTTDLFIKELFSAISNSLAKGENVKIKGIGIFKTTGNADNPVIFAPDPDLADALNMPFACFEAIELDDDLNLDEVEDNSEETNIINANDNAIIIEQDLPIEAEVNTVTNNEAVELSDNESISDEERQIEVSVPDDTNSNNDIESPIDIPEDCLDQEEENAQQASDIIDNVNETIVDTDYETIEATSTKHSWKIIVALIAGIIAGYILGIRFPYKANVMNNQIEKTSIIDDEEIVDSIITNRDTIHHCEKIDSINQSSIQDSNVTDPEIIDTIGTTRFLTTMSREYYGEMIFWVYIYEENKDKLGNPNRIKPGTTVKIPSAEKYGINRLDSASVALAKLKAMEIYAPYQK